MTFYICLLLFFLIQLNFYLNMFTIILGVVIEFSYHYGVCKDSNKTSKCTALRS